MTENREQRELKARRYVRTGVQTRRDVIRGVAARWEHQYGPNFADTMSGSSRAVYDRLLALDGETATRAQVGEIIGNGSWTENNCDCCEQDVEVVVVFEDGYERSFAACPECLTAATEKLSTVSAPKPRADAPHE